MAKAEPARRVRLEDKWSPADFASNTHIAKDASGRYFAEQHDLRTLREWFKRSRTAEAREIVLEALNKLEAEYGHE